MARWVFWRRLSGGIRCFWWRRPARARRRRAAPARSTRGKVELAAYLSDTVKKWHAAGRIQELEKTWGIPPSVFAEEMHRRFADG